MKIIATSSIPADQGALQAVLLCATLGLSWLGAGCEPKAPPAGGQAGDPAGAGAQAPAGAFVAGSKTQGVFTISLQADPETFDPGTMSGAPEGRIAFDLFEGLMMPAPSTQEEQGKIVVPGVAKDYPAISEDGKTYTFTLRQDAKWSDGSPVTAHDFVESWRRVLTPDFPADYAQMLWVIEGAEEFNTKKTEDWQRVGVKATDDHTLVVTLKQPTPYFEELVAFYTFFPVPTKLVAQKGKEWTKPEHIVSNGAFRLAQYKPQQEVVLERSPHYWGKEQVKLERVRMRIIADRNAAVNAYLTGELHWAAGGLPMAQITSLLTHPDYMSEPMLGTYYFRINVSKPGPLQDVRVRQALNMAVDRDSLVDQTMSGLYAKATAMVPESMPGYKSISQVSYNPKKAKALMEEAGLGKDKNVEIELLYNTDENHKLVAEAVQAMWKRNLGVEVKLVNKEWKTYLQDIDTLNYQVARAGWIGDFNDPMTFLDMWVSGNGNNDTGWSDAEYDGLIAQANAQPDRAKRQELLQRAEQLLLERGPVIPIYYYINNQLISRQVQGFKPHNRDVHLLKYMSLPDAASAPAKSSSSAQP